MPAAAGMPSGTAFLHHTFMTEGVSQALCSAMPIALGGDGAAPEWLHLLPVGPDGLVRTRDKRGPYKAGDLAALMAASLPAGEKLVLDENHSTDLAAPKGVEAPARGWIVELQARENGIWGRVEWTPKGRQLVADREYRGISPVIAHRKDKTLVAIRRASLVNQPNLDGLTALHSEDNGMDFMKKTAAALGLGDDATEESILAAVKKALDAKPEVAVQAALSPIAEKLGVEADGDLVAAIEALQAAKPATESEAVTALQSELAETVTQLNALQDGIARKDAEAFVDAAIAEGRVGVKPLRDEYIAMHMEDPAKARRMIGAAPKVGGRHRSGDPAPTRSTDLDDADRSVIALMGLDAAEFKKTRAAEVGETEEAL